MQLIQILLPLYTRAGQTIPESEFTRVRLELTQVFGGVTAYVQSPATGLWKKSKHKTEKDQVILIEAMVPRIKRAWWERYRKSLEKRFQQKEVLIRALPIQRL